MNHYLLSTDAHGNEEVLQYLDTEMDELFTQDERKALADGCAIDHEVPYGMLRIVDMRVAARFIK